MWLFAFWAKFDGICLAWRCFEEHHQGRYKAKVKRSRVLITGTAGFLGSSVKRQFLQADWDVIGISRAGDGDPLGFEIDFADAESLKTLRQISDVDVIIHLASHVDFSPNAPSRLFRATNQDAVVELTDLARRFKSHIVFVSGSLVHGKKIYINQTSEIAPELPYAKAKQNAERLFGQYLGPLTILRPGGIFGYPGPRHLGINNAIAEAVEIGTPPTCYGLGTAQRNYIFVEDLARIILFVVKNSILGCHLVGGSERMTIVQMLELVAKKLIGPDSTVLMCAGGTSTDMIVEPSRVLPETRSFEEAIVAIKDSLGLENDSTALR